MGRQSEPPVYILLGSFLENGESSGKVVGSIHRWFPSLKPARDTNYRYIVNTIYSRCSQLDRIAISDRN
jgi:hypothetical protein